MSSVLPSTKAELLAFCQSHAPIWAASGAAIGLTTSDTDDFTTLTTEAAATSTAAVTARNAAKAATLTDNNAFAALRADAAALVAKIKFKAESTDDPNVYVNAQIPEPLPPSPAPAPTQPTMLRASIEPGGGLTINWKASNPASNGGVVYQVFRKLPTQPSFNLVGFSGGRDKYFTDLTLPAGNSGVQYVIQGARGGVSGAQSEILTVNFGIEGGGGGGFAFSTMSHDQPVRIAA